ncbi:MAG: response regulator [Prolixibacteraceae bacterium]|nr:response regulator [Prolixibacteraceae bacterium]MBN2772924.1 response regulator [Prolixibacteraceae bacterium]
MKNLYANIFLFFLLCNPVFAAKIERFEHINSLQGLSQNAALCLYCDNEGYLWVGTMNGLNRYDGYNFRIFKTEDGLSNNRIASIREDLRGFLWIETYEGYYHFFNKQQEKFTGFPFYRRNTEEKNSFITCFHQSDSNLVWLGSGNSGFYRLIFNEEKYDYEISQFLSRGSNTVTNNTINFIITDSLKNIWIGTKNGLNLIKAENVYDENPVISHFNIEINFTSAINWQGKVWFGTAKNGIITYDNKKSVFESINIPEVYNIEKISSIKKSENGLIIGTINSGCYFFSSDDKSISRIPVLGEKIKSIYVDRKNYAWISTDEHGISRFSASTGEVRHFQLSTESIRPLIDDERHYLYEDNAGQLWIACHGGGLALFNNENQQFDFFRNEPGNNNSISSNFVHCIIQDKSGNYWIGTSRYSGGVNKIIFSNPAFTNIAPNKNFSLQAENEIKAVFEDSQGNLWVSSRYGEIHIYNNELGKIGTLSVSDEGTKNNVYAIIEDKKNRICLGARPGGIFISEKPIYKYSDFKDIKFIHYSSNAGVNGSMIIDNVFSMLNDIEGNIWIGTYGEGITVATEDKAGEFSFRNVNSENSCLSNDYVRNIFSDSYGNLWIGTVFGLNLLKKENLLKNDFNFEVFLNDPENNQSISYNDIIKIFEDSEKNIWVSTFGNGLNKLTQDSSGNFHFSRYSKTNGLSNDIVYGILEDKNKHLWFSTESGLSVFYPEKERFESYSISNGLYSQGFLENSCYLLKNGKLAFGATFGFVIVDVDKLEPGFNYQNLVFNNFQLLNTELEPNSKKSPLKKSILFTKDIRLNYNQNSFSFEFSALNLTAPDQIQYAYQLVNYEPDWNYSGNSRVATYKNVSPGKYIFRVKSTNLDGDWNKNEKQVIINILPPWWATKIAYIGYFILLLFLLEASRRVISKYNRLRTDLRVERRVNDIKLKFFTNISHEIRTPLTLIMGPLNDLKRIKNLPPSVMNPLEIMNRNGKRMLRLVNQLLDFRKIQNQKMKLSVEKTETVKFVHDICMNFEKLASQKKIKYFYPETYFEIDAWFDREKLDSVLFNLLSNAFKFTPEGKSIRVEVAENKSDGFIEIKIADKGKGISRDKIPLLFQRFTSLASENIDFTGTGIGLAYSYELVKLHKGDIEVESEPGKGSVFTVKLLPGKNHFTKDDLCLEEENAEIQKTHATEYELTLNDTFTSLHDESGKKTYTVLFVEDNSEVKYYVAGILEKCFNVVTANNGLEGLDLIEKIHPDLVITDIMMPEMDGITMTKKVKENFSVSHIPVIMLTAKSTLHDQIEGIESGAEAYVLKPFNANYLITVIQNLLKQRMLIFRKFQDQLPLSSEIKITNRDKEFLENTIRLIEINCQDPDFNVEQLVKECALGRTGFYNKIKGLTGLSPVEFLRKTRLRIAARYLSEPGYRVAEAADLTGFRDVKYFTRCFKNEFGDVPSVYKKKLSVGQDIKSENQY